MMKALYNALAAAAFFYFLLSSFFRHLLRCFKVQIDTKCGHRLCLHYYGSWACLTNDLMTLPILKNAMQ